MFNDWCILFQACQSFCIIFNIIIIFLSCGSSSVHKLKLIMSNTYCSCFPHSPLPEKCDGLGFLFILNFSGEVSSQKRKVNYVHKNRFMFYICVRIYFVKQSMVLSRPWFLTYPWINLNNESIYLIVDAYCNHVYCW